MIYHLHLLTHDKWMRNVALVSSAVPALFFAVFAAGEILDGNMSGMLHLFQLIILAILVFIALKRPYIGGVIMLFSGLILSMNYVSATRHLPVEVIITVISIFFIPLIVSGVLFISFGRGHQLPE